MAEYGWSDKITAEESSFEVWPEGEYNFIVKDFERGRVKNGKFAGCNQAVYTLHITNEEGRSIDKQYYIPLDDSLKWKATQFFRAIGMLEAKDGEEFAPAWDKCLGCKGRCELTVREYVKTQGDNAGKKAETNDIARVMPVNEVAEDYGDL